MVAYVTTASDRCYSTLFVRGVLVSSDSTKSLINMAKGNMLLGMARKKVGDLVFYRANGDQITRARNRAPKNPRSAKQSIQRMVLATASKMAAAWRPIVDHSFEGYNVGTDSVRHFQQLAMARLRGQAAYIINGGTEFAVADFAIKGAPIVGLSEGLRISSGTLTMQPTIIEDDGILKITTKKFASIGDAITTQAGYVEALNELGFEPGDQMTFVCVQLNTQMPVASFGSEKNYAQRVRYARVVFVPTIPENFNGKLIANGSFNSALVERTEGVFPTLNVNADEDVTMQSTDGDFVAIQAGIIRSQIDVNGKWRYSTCDLAATRDNFDWNNAAGVYPSYMDNVEGIELGDNLYLRNAVAAPLA